MKGPVAVVMPYHGEARFRLASWVRQRYQALHPGWSFHVATDGGAPWTKARAVNRGVPDAAEIVIVTDADVAVPAKALEWAVDRVVEGAAWAVPYGFVYRLDRERTALTLGRSPAVEIEAFRADECARAPYPAVPGGGIFVVARDAWETARGFDLRFHFAQEDAPLGYALDTLAGPHEQLPAPLLHLWHEPRDPHGRGAELAADMKLENRYLAARGDPIAMAALIRERGAGPAVTVKRP